VITFDGESMTLTEQDHTLHQIKSRIAKILLENAGDNSNGNNHLAQRDIAASLCIGWDTVHQALESLYRDGVIRIERNRIILNKELIQKVAEAA
jgi:DNA-binding transcriptional regulator YhcF (GntR family)